MATFNQQLEIIRNRPGFIAALDQSGGSTPKALEDYGIAKIAWSSDGEMLALVHEMRSRIIQSSCFNESRIVGAILFEDTLDRTIEYRPTAEYLWSVKRIVPFLKIDQGLAKEDDGVQLMKPITTLADALAKAKQQPVFGTKMRSVIRQASSSGIDVVVDQQFDIAIEIVEGGFVPIIEPEIDIHCHDKARAEDLLVGAITRRLDRLNTDQVVMLKLTLPEIDNRYADLLSCPNVLKVVALSGGYSRVEANERLFRQRGIIASFSRALAEGLTAKQSDLQFDLTLGRSIDSIFAASIK